VHGFPFRPETLQKYQQQLDQGLLIKCFEETKKDPQWAAQLTTRWQQSRERKIADVDAQLQALKDDTTAANEMAKLKELRKQLVEQKSLTPDQYFRRKLKAFMAEQFRALNPQINETMLQRQLSEFDDNQQQPPDLNLDHAFEAVTKDPNWFTRVDLPKHINPKNVQLPTLEEWRQHYIPKQQDLFDFPIGPGFNEFNFEAEFEKTRKEAWEQYEAKLREIETVLPPDPHRQRPIFRPEDY